MFFKSKDIMGQALLNYMDGNKDEKIIVRSLAKLGHDKVISGSEEFSVFEYFKGIEDMMEVDRRGLDMCYGKVLDIGSAAGSHSLILKDRGIDVYSVDMSPGAVSVMKRRGLENIYCRPVQKLKNLKCDTLFFAGNNHGLFGSIEKLELFLKNSINNLVKEDGQILIASPYIDIPIAGYDSHEKLKYVDLDMELEYKKNKSKKFKWCMIAADYLVQYLQDHGWHVKEYKSKNEKTSLIKIRCIIK